ncbi:MAG: glycogen/starch/alpha-glucan phosphorylase, partial [Desulfobacteraceae bacterium]|nr:glycogen/starch/alpha-glucan phosphorylase [Desulfobacteraceae bacterium]
KLEKVKKDNKIKLARVIKDICNINVNVDSIFDVHIKRIHEYKRQMLNIMNIIHMYIRIKEDNIEPENPRTFIFSGKAAPGYFTAKLIINLIHNIADVINNDPEVNKWINVVFIPDYKVSLAEKIIPAADVSEQISTAGMEASGTGNMKLAMNGAITIGTLDGANIEIYQEVGESNIYIFGLDVKGVENKRHNYNPEQYLQKVPELRRVLIVLNSDYFCKSEPGIFQPLYDNFMVHGDYYLHMADFESYIEAQANISKDFSFRVDWTVKSLINISRTSKFSSDRTIKEYADDIWGIKPFQ